MVVCTGPASAWQQEHTVTLQLVHSVRLRAHLLCGWAAADGRAASAAGAPCAAPVAGPGRLAVAPVDWTALLRAACSAWQRRTPRH